LSSVANAAQIRPPTALSSMPPTQQGTFASRQRLWIATAFVSPAARPGLMFIQRQLPRSSACSARNAERAQQIADRVHHAEIGPDVDRGARGAKQLMQRHSAALGFEHPPGRVERGFGEGVSLEVGQPRLQCVARFDPPTPLRRGFLTSTSNGVGALALVSLLEADGVLACDAPGTPTNPLARRPPHFAPPAGVNGSI